MLLDFIKKYKYLFIIAFIIAFITNTFITNIFITNFSYLKNLKEGLELLTFSELDSTLNPDFYPCNNFCGPKAECAITREQCVKDNDCSDCYNSKLEEGFSNKNQNQNQNRRMYDSMETSSLTTDTSTFATVIEKDAAVPKMYLGPDLWTKAFNYGLGLSEEKLQYRVKRHPEKYKFVPKYQVTETATGMFYNTGPIAANAELS
jgi:hypothetical protein